MQQNHVWVVVAHHCINARVCTLPIENVVRFMTGVSFVSTGKYRWVVRPISGSGTHHLIVAAALAQEVFKFLSIAWCAQAIAKWRVKSEAFRYRVTYRHNSLTACDFAVGFGAGSCHLEIFCCIPLPKDTKACSIEVCA